MLRKALRGLRGRRRQVFARDHVEAQPASRLERLEPRVLLSADFSGLDAAAEPPATALSFHDYAVTSFTRQDKRTSVFNILDGGATLAIEGNGWKRIELPHDINVNTVLEFDFLSTSQGDFHAIGLETDNRYTARNVFKLLGDERGKFLEAESYAGTEGEWKHYKLHLGALAGSAKYLVFINDHDTRYADATSFFSNVKLYDQTPEPPPTGASDSLNFYDYAIGGFKGQDAKTGTYQVLDGGSTLNLHGNAWKQIGLNYTLTPDTVVEFDFRSMVEGDFHAIGFETDSRFSAERFVKLYGPEENRKFITAESYDGSETEWKHYRIAIGELLTGDVTSLVFANDHDVRRPTADASFTNIRIYEAAAPAPALPPDIDIPSEWPPQAVYSTQYGYGLVDAAGAIAMATGLSGPLPDVPTWGGANDWNLNMINAPEAWSAGFTGAGVVVAVIDTGVDFNHPEFASRIWSNAGEIAGNGLDDDGNGYIDDIRGWDFVDYDNTPLDGNGHGTHVAGTIAGANDGVGVTGVAFDATIMAVRVLDNAGSGFLSSVVSGIYYAANNGADVINLSLGSTSGTSSLDTAVKYAQSLGVVVVMAAGNNGGVSPIYPAAYADEWGIAAGAVDSSGRLTGYSNRSGETVLDYVVAPGSSIYSSVPGGGYSWASGTSMATPHVAGVAALVKSANPALTAAQIETVLVATANHSAVIV